MVFEVLIDLVLTDSQGHGDTIGVGAIAVGQRGKAGWDGGADGVVSWQQAGEEVVAGAVGGHGEGLVIAGAFDAIVSCVDQGHGDVGLHGFAGLGETIAVALDHRSGDAAEGEHVAEVFPGHIACDVGDRGGVVDGGVRIDGLHIGGTAEGRWAHGDGDV